MRDLETELHHLGEADVRLALIRRQIDDLENLMSATDNPSVLNTYSRSMQLLVKTQQTFEDHRLHLLAAVDRLQSDT